jgi:hypothetical protein
VLVILGALACGRAVTVLALGGSILLYLSMFQLASSSASGGGTSMAAMAMQSSHGTLRADSSSFYTGLGLFVCALGLSAWRRHRRRCVPLLRLHRAGSVA